MMKVLWWVWGRLIILILTASFWIKNLMFWTHYLHSLAGHSVVGTGWRARCWMQNHDSVNCYCSKLYVTPVCAGGVGCACFCLIIPVLLLFFFLGGGFCEWLQDFDSTINVHVAGPHLKSWSLSWTTCRKNFITAAQIHIWVLKFAYLIGEGLHDLHFGILAKI